MTPKSPVVTVDHELFGLSDAGAILALPDSTYPYPQTDPAEGVAASFVLRTYSGSTVPLLPDQDFVKGPRIAGHTMAWIDAHGALQLAPVPLS